MSGRHAVFTAVDASCGDFLLEHWLASLRAHVDLSRIDVNVLDYGLSEGQRGRLRASGVRLHPCVKDGHVVNLRYRDLARVLPRAGYDQVLLVDGGDLIFQADVSGLFERDKDRLRAVPEERALPSRELFDFFLRKSARTRGRFAEIRRYLDGKPVVNGGFVLGPAARMAGIWDAHRELWERPGVFGLDQLIVNYELYRSGFAALESRYNFVISAARSPFTLRDGVFLDAEGRPIPVVHNAGMWQIARCVRLFGHGPGRNRLKPATRLALLAMAWTFGALISAGKALGVGPDS